MNQEKVGKFIKKLRIDNKLTQAEFADKLGVTYQAVSKWENGKNVPDIATLKDISNLFNVDIDEIISGEEKKKEKISNNKTPLIILSLIIVLLVGFMIVFFLNHKHKEDLEIQDITTTCENFKVVGSLIHSNNKSYIRISNIEYCDEEDTIYKEIECTLYEKNGDITNKITSCNKGYNDTLKNHLSMVKLSADDYDSICSIDEKNLYIEIHAIDNNDKTITYKVPLEVNDNCNN